MDTKPFRNGKHKLSLDIESASQVNDVKIWTTDESKRLIGLVSNNITHDVDGDVNERIHGNVETGKSRADSELGHVDDRKEELTCDSRKSVGKSTKNADKPNIKDSSVELSCRERYLSWRYVIVWLLQSSMVVQIFLRNCMPMAMVCMVDTSASSSSLMSSSSSNGTRNETAVQDGMVTSRAEQTSVRNSIYLDNGTSDERSTYEFNWDSDVQGLILSSPLFLSFLGPLTIEQVRIRLGNKLTMTLTTLVSALCTFLAPTAARIHPYLLVATRILIGFSLGGNIPVLGDTLAWWAPQAEKLTMSALTFTGVNIGAILASFISGFLCAIPVDNGWPFIFYVFGTLTLLWCMAWHFLSSQKPEDHPFISEKEKEYIVSHRVGMETDGGKSQRPPYRAIFTSVPVIAFLISISCHGWAAMLLFTYLPVYFNKIMEFPVQLTGVLVSVVSATRMLGTLMWTIIGNKLMTCLSINAARKICIFSGFFLAAASQVGVGFFDQSQRWAAFSLLIIVMVAQSVGSATLMAVPLDMAPRYAGFLTGATVTVTSLVAISGPLVTAALTANGTVEEWRTVWLIMGASFLSASLIFTIFGKASLRPWAQASIPHIVSPFVTMGRRFSAFIDALPLTPATPRRNNMFNFAASTVTSASTVLQNLASASPEILTMGTVNQAFFQGDAVKEHVSNGGFAYKERSDELPDGYENKAFEEDNLNRPSVTEACPREEEEIKKNRNQEMNCEDEEQLYRLNGDGQAEQEPRTSYMPGSHQQAQVDSGVSEKLTISQEDIIPVIKNECTRL